MYFFYLFNLCNVLELLYFLGGLISRHIRLMLGLKGKWNSCVKGLVMKVSNFDGSMFLFNGFYFFVGGLFFTNSKGLSASDSTCILSCHQNMCSLDL